MDQLLRPPAVQAQPPVAQPAALLAAQPQAPQPPASPLQASDAGIERVRVLPNELVGFAMRLDPEAGTLLREGRLFLRAAAAGPGEGDDASASTPADAAHEPVGTCEASPMSLAGNY